MTGGGAGAAGGLVFRAATADRAALERVLRASGVERRPEPPDASYLRDLWASFYTGMAELYERASGWLGLPRWLLVSATALLLAAAVALLARAWWPRWRRRGGGEPPDAAGATDLGDEAAGERRTAGSARWDAAAWRRELERWLAAGEPKKALHATWWWLARSLAGMGAEPTWTGRELLRRSRREDLGQLVRQLDGMTYGPRPPAAEEVRLLAARLEAALG
jgi:hypothetical protein